MPSRQGNPRMVFRFPLHLVLCPLKSMDANRYATKKTIAQGMLDIALLTANASQLKYILQVGEKHEFYGLMLTLISISIILQVIMGVLNLSLSLLRDCRLHLPEYHRSANVINYIMLVGILFVVIGSLNINRKPDQTAAIVLNDIILVLIFVISLINVIISGFGIEYSSQPLRLLDRVADQPAQMSTGQPMAGSLRVSAALLAVILTLVNLHGGEVQRKVANILNHFSLGFVVVALFCDIIKMNFGLDPAIPYIVQGISCILLANYNINKETSVERANAVQNFSLGLNMATVVVNIMINGMEVKHMDDVGPGLGIESTTKGV
ncbi:AGAP002124-PA-like protein [Anopheles sinensis]|uniref:AGAP002124-PA-like protein n=1 Tax=Anopheles sinensis TaxID=74873 RepID=A0A084VE05_ANOSI|nr:AGAP002124-PA-like protein [Anopheles sinensis]